jgi:hypothetical protein
MEIHEKTVSRQLINQSDLKNNQDLLPMMPEGGLRG